MRAALSGHGAVLRNMKGKRKNDSGTRAALRRPFQPIANVLA